MPRLKHVVEFDYKPTFRSEKVASMFDVPVTEKLSKSWDIEIPSSFYEKSWNIGLIVGASGSGKTTLASKMFGGKIHAGFEWKSRCMLDDFPSQVNVTEITETLSKVGFSSPPSWLLPHSCLSNGQKFRVELARCLLEYDSTFVFDEFTSVVDRQVAQIGSYAFQKAIRRANRSFVAVTCHYDVEPWLEPDWILDVSSGEFRWGSLRRPSINLEIFRCDRSAWNLFKDHHYLTADISNAAVCFVGCIDGRPVVFDAWLSFFGRLSHGKAMRGHRTVCLPDFQGLGIGNRLFTEVSRMWAGLGYRVFSGTGHPAEIKKRISSGEWKMTRQGRTSRESQKRVGREVKHASNRLTAGFEFIGEPMNAFDASKLYSR